MGRGADGMCVVGPDVVVSMSQVGARVIASTCWCLVGDGG